MEINFIPALDVWSIRRGMVEYLIKNTFLREQFGGSIEDFMGAVDRSEIELVPLSSFSLPGNDNSRADDIIEIAEALNVNTSAE